MHRHAAVIVALIGLAISLPAQTVRLANHSAGAFAGYKRVTIDRVPTALTGEIDGARYVVGRQVGLDTRTCDIWCKLAPGERRTLELTDASPIDWRIAPLPANPLAWFGGPVDLDGQAMALVGFEIDGAAYVAHLRARTGRMFVVDLWVRWYPDEPALAYGEAVVTASNPTVPDMGEARATAIKLRFGDAMVLIPGAPPGQLVAAGDRFADGQARALPLHFVWLRHLRSASDWSSVGAATSFAIGGVGLERLLPRGNPLMPAGTNPIAWANQRLQSAVDRLHTWQEGVVGIARTSTQAGDQNDQLFPGGHPMLPDGAGSEAVVYLSALKWANRPCHHLEADGSIVDTAAHPQLTYWQGRAHYNRGVSPDQLGKPRELRGEESNQWWGPDRDHWLIGYLTAAARLTGSHYCQWELQHQGQMFLGQETVRPGWSTSGADAARCVGYAGMVATYLHCNMTDRELAGRVAQRWRDRWHLVYLPAFGTRPGNVWDPRNDARILQDFDVGRPKRYTLGTLWWQQSLGAYGMDLAGEFLGPPAARDMALRAANATIDHAYRFQGNAWVEWDNVGFTDGTPLPDDEMQEGKGAHRTGWYRLDWFPCAIATVLVHEPQHPRARAIWAQMLAWSGGGGRWMPPGGGK